jgi:hypothetical protein
MENRMFSHLVNRQGKDGQDNFVYVLDSDEDNSRDIPIKKPEIASNNNNFYSHNLSQKENFYNTDRLEESQSKNMTMSDNADNFFRGLKKKKIEPGTSYSPYPHILAFNNRRR